MTMNRRKQPPAILQRYCLGCGSPFSARKKSAQFCSGTCRSNIARSVKKAKTLSKNAKPTKNKPKELELTLIHCVGCDATWLDSRNTSRCYCTASCKQRAYRNRKARGIDYLGRKVKS